MTGSTTVGKIGKQIFPADLNASVVAIRDVPVGIAFPVARAPCSLRVVEGFNYPLGHPPIPFLSDVLGTEGDEARRVDDDVETGPEDRFLRLKYLDAPFPAPGPDILDVASRAVRPSNHL